MTNAQAQANRRAARKRLGLQPHDHKDLHHIDPTLYYRDRERYDGWFDEDLVVMDRTEHQKLHKTGKEAWNKGKTKAEGYNVTGDVSGEKNGMFGRVPWNKGLTKDTDERVRKGAEGVSKSTQGRVPWNKGLKKEVLA